MGSSISTRKRTQDHHYPTPEDVFAVRSSLSAFVPVELADLILNEAKYWPKATCSCKPEPPAVLAASNARHWANNATVCCLLTPKLCDLLYSDMDRAIKIKVICFKIVSHDQGWCDAGDFPPSRPYAGSYTWFEGLIVRDFIYEHAATGSSDVEFEMKMIHHILNHRGNGTRVNNSEDDTEDPNWEEDTQYPNYDVVTVKTPNDKNSDVWNIQRNKRACGKYQLHTVVWTEEEEAADESVLMDETGRGLGRGFVRSPKMDDRFAVMARAQYPGWVNYIKSVELEIYYSV